MIDNRSPDTYNLNDPFKFSSQSNSSPEKRFEAEMNATDKKEIQHMELERTSQLPKYVSKMYPYSAKALDSIENVIPAIISVMSSFPHRPNEELHSEMTSTRDYMPPLPD